MENCIFCKIVKGEIPSVKIWEDEKHIAILDLMPNSEGMTLVITKNHFDSYAFDMPEKEYLDFLSASKKVAKILEKGLSVKRVAMVMEGLGVNHAHIKLYPLYGLDKKFQEMWHPDKIFFDKYRGYVSTQTGPEKSIEERQKVADKILDNNKVFK
ncbi:MAG: HIT domain-containing protein [archaeon]